jgi:hypothetical protein
MAEEEEVLVANPVPRFNPGSHRAGGALKVLHYIMRDDDVSPRGLLQALACGPRRGPRAGALCEGAVAPLRDEPALPHQR